MNRITREMAALRAANADPRPESDQALDEAIDRLINTLSADVSAEPASEISRAPEHADSAPTVLIRHPRHRTISECTPTSDPLPRQP